MTNASFADDRFIGSNKNTIWLGDTNLQRPGHLLIGVPNFILTSTSITALILIVWK